MIKQTMLPAINAIFHPMLEPPTAEAPAVSALSGRELDAGKGGSVLWEKESSQAVPRPAVSKNPGEIDMDYINQLIEEISEKKS